MNEDADSPPRPSEVAMWHRLSGLPDNVTDAGDIVEVDAGRRLSAEKALLRASIAELSAAQMPDETRGLARLAASYLLAGDVETARRYATRARECIEEANHATD
jgi:hypothetical protein